MTNTNSSNPYEKKPDEILSEIGRYVTNKDSKDETYKDKGGKRLKKELLRTYNISSKEFPLEELVSAIAHNIEEKDDAPDFEKATTYAMIIASGSTIPYNGTIFKYMSFKSNGQDKENADMYKVNLHIAPRSIL